LGGSPVPNIPRSITPDNLDQQYQGVVKYLINWLKEACGEAEIDARCCRLRPNHNIRLFMNGISNLNCVIGKEHDQISRFLLDIILGIRHIGRTSTYIPGTTLRKMSKCQTPLG
jgi:hypothetical protein